MSSKPRMWSAWPCVSKMASRRSSPTRSACWRKSGVVSITTFWPPREISREGRSLLSCGSFEWHTRQGHPSVGTPMDVPEPRTVIFSGAGGMVKALETNHHAEPGRTAGRFLWAGLSLGFRGLGRNRLIDLQKGHLQLAQEVQEQVVFFRGEIAFGLVMQSVKHVNQLARGVGIDHRLAGARVSVRAEHHGSVAPEHSNEIFERGGTLRCLGRRWRSNCFCCLGGCGRNLRRLPLGFPLFFLDDFLAQFAFGGKRTAVDNAKRFFLFVVGQGTFLSDLSLVEFITGCQVASLRRVPFKSAMLVKATVAP